MSKALERSKLVPGITDRKDGVVLGTSPFPSDLFMSNIPEYVNEPVPDLLPENLDDAKSLADTSGLKGQTAILLYSDSLGDFGAAMAQNIVAQLARIGVTVEAKRTGDQVFKRLVFSEKNYELALVYSEGSKRVLEPWPWFRSNGELNISGVRDSELDALFERREKTVDTTAGSSLRSDKQRVSEPTPSCSFSSFKRTTFAYLDRSR
jgi:ABC-type transport system substrate-binding protein